MVEYEVGCGNKKKRKKNNGRVPLIITLHRATTLCRFENLHLAVWRSIGGSRDEIPSRILRFSAWNHDFYTRTRISRLVRHWLPFERVVQHTRRLRLYELQRKEPLYNPRWPPPRRGLLLANTKQEAPPWLTARDGMIYWDFCLFAPALQRTHHA